MAVNIDKWSKRKRVFWEKIWIDLEIGYLDRDLLPLLILINRDKELYTTSSCSGRIVVVDSDYPWSRNETSALLKSHVPIKLEDLLFIYRSSPYRNIWINTTGPIIHIYTLNTKSALLILEIARRAGFKHSGILHYSSSKGFFLELISGIYVSQLIRTPDTIIVDLEKLPSLLNIVNNALIEGKKRLQQLYLELSRILPRIEDENIVSDIEKKSYTQYKRSPIDVFREMCKEKSIYCNAY